MSNYKVIYRFHAVRRMFERRITELEILEVLKRGKTIEDYPADLPYPSRLILGVVNGRTLHVVAADAKESQETIIITVYEPDPGSWQPGYENRRKS